MRTLPIRVRLTLWYLLVFSIALGAFGISAWLLVRQRLYSDMTEQLESRIESVTHYITSQGENASRAHLNGELKEEYDAEDEGTWLQIVDDDGNWMYRSQAMEAAFPSIDKSSDVPNKGKMWNAKGNNVRLRVIEKPIVVFRRHYLVETAVPVEGVQRTLYSLGTILLLLAPAFIAFAGIGSYYMSRRAMSSVDAITALARSINDRSLDRRLPALDSNDELQRLSDTLNQMLGRIEASFQRVRQFTADASHELRTPVSLIRIEAELALRKNRTESDYRNALTQILAESIRTSEMIDSLLSLARADSGAHVLQLRPTASLRLLAEVADDWQPMFQKQGLTFALQTPEQEVSVLADYATIRRLLFILLDNARKYTPPGGNVNLRAVTEGTRLKISVEDSGIGIESQHLPHIFERFYRVDEARSRSAGGVGLGLSLAKWIAEQHQTNIEVKSSANSGATFSFFLEAVSPVSDDASSSHSNSGAGKLL